MAVGSALRGARAMAGRQGRTGGVEGWRQVVAAWLAVPAGWAGGGGKQGAKAGRGLCGWRGAKELQGENAWTGGAEGGGRRAEIVGG